jgi:streptogramin lyase
MSQPKTTFQSLTIIIATLTLLLSFAPLAFGSTDYVVPPGRQAWAQNITVGADHNLWFTELEGKKIGRLTTSGTLTEFAVKGQSLVGVASGPDGNIWFTDQFAGKIGHINTNGGQLQQFSLPVGSYPQGMTVGPDGNLWFVDQKKNGKFKIGKITLAGKITEYATNLNAGDFQAYSSLYGQITVGPDRNLWFVNPQLANLGTLLVGKITTSGAVTTYTMKDSPLGICAGPKGYLWVIESGSHVAKVSTSGKETEYVLPSGRAGWAGITPGPDGNIWFTELARGVGYVTPSTGNVTEFPGRLFASMQYLNGIVAGPDGALWLTGGNTSNLARFTTTGQLTNTYALDNGSAPVWSTLGPDDAVWFTAIAANAVGSVSTTGVVTTHSIPTQGSVPEGITTGPDGNLWFLENSANQVGKITTSGAFQEFSLGQSFRGLWGITAGPDGNLWFPEYFANNIAQITTGGSIMEFPVPTPSAFPEFITNGPDGNLWFTENAASQIGKIDPSTGTITEYPLGANKGPGAITVGPDKNLWFLENTGTGAIGVMDTSGQLLAEYPVIFQNFPEGLVAAPDGALWLAQNYPSGLARVSTKGAVSYVTLTATNAAPNDLAVGTDGKLWIVDAAAGDISRLSAIGGKGKTITANHGSGFTGAVASFIDGTPTATKADFSASISWGDGTKSAGTVSGPTGGPFAVKGSHIYANAGGFKLLVSLTDTVDKSDYLASPGKANVK